MLHFCVTCGTFSTSHQLLRMNQARLIEFPDLLTMTNLTTRWHLRQFPFYIIENICSKPYLLYLHTFDKPILVFHDISLFFLNLDIMLQVQKLQNQFIITRFLYSSLGQAIGPLWDLLANAYCVVRQRLSCQRPDKIEQINGICSHSTSNKALEMPLIWSFLPETRCGRFLVDLWPLHH